MMYRVWIQGLQFLSILFMWAFTAGIVSLAVWLILVSIRWQDALNWTVAISLIMTPVYLTVSATLTYVFIGLRRGASKQAGDLQRRDTSDEPRDPTSDGMLGRPTTRR